MANTDSGKLNLPKTMLTPSSKPEGVMPIWEYLSFTDRPIVLYGTGNGADKILDQLEKRKIQISGIFASSDFVRDRSFRGFKVETFDALYARFPDMIVLVCFGTSRPEVLANIDRIAEKCEVYAPDVPVYGGNLFDREFYLAHEAELQEVRAMLADDISRDTFDAIVNYKLSGDFRLLRPCERPLDDNVGLLMYFDEDGCFVDLGAYTGDTVEYYSSSYPVSLSKVIAVEPDARNFRKLQETSARLSVTPRMLHPRPSDTPLSISCVRALISDHDGVVTIDRNKGRGVHDTSIPNKGTNSVSETPASGSAQAMSASSEEIRAISLVTLLKDEKASLIKMDVEGNERLAIEGGRAILKRDKPDLIVSCYHRSEDLFTLPLLLKEIVPDYKIYMRHHPHLLSWDTEFLVTT